MIVEDARGLSFDVQVQPRASRDRIGPLAGDRDKVQLTAPPVEGAANEALRALLSGAFRVAKRYVEIVRGETGRKKTVRVLGATRAALDALLGGK